MGPLQPQEALLTTESSTKLLNIFNDKKEYVKLYTKDKIKNMGNDKYF